MLLFKLLDIVEQEREDEERRHLAALWINSIFCSFGQLIMAQSIFHTLEYTIQKKSGKLDTKISSQRIKENLQEKYPYLRNVLWLDVSNTIPYFLRDENFLSRLLLNTNKFSSLLIDPIFKWFTSNIDEQTKAHLLELLLTYTFPEYDSVNMDSNSDVSKIYTVQDLDPNPIENEMQIRNKIKRATKKKAAHSLADQVIRNLHWKSAHDTYQWVGCPIGLLPWQTDSLKSLKPLDVNPSRHTVSVLDSQIVAGIINRKNLKMQSRIKWDNVLRKKKENREET